MSLIFRDFTKDQRTAAAKRGHALPNGSFPIESEEDLRNAIRAIGRAKDPAAARAHIKKRARALGLTSILGPSFKAAEPAADDDAGNDVEPWLTTAHKHDHVHETGMSHDHPHGHTADELADHGDENAHNTTHHELQHQIAMAHSEPIGTVANAVGTLQTPSVEDRGVDNTGAHAMTDAQNDGDEDDNPMHGAEGHKCSEGCAMYSAYQEPSTGDVHVPAPLHGVSVGTGGAGRRNPAAAVWAPLRRALGAVAGRQPLAATEAARRFWDNDNDADDESGAPPKDDDDDDPASDALPPYLATVGATWPAAGATVAAPAGFNAYTDTAFTPGAPRRPLLTQNLADLCAAPAGVLPVTRLFVEIKPSAWDNFVQGGRHIPYLPKPGVYSHPAYGTVVITRERNRRFVEHMNSHVYQSRIAIDLEHQGDLSGAALWADNLRMNEDGSADAHIDEVTPMGETMLRENRYLYVSPTLRDEWKQPHTGQTFQDVPVGGALTRTPFFKEASLRSLVASENGVHVLTPTRVQDVGTSSPIQHLKLGSTTANASTWQFTNSGGATMPNEQTQQVAQGAQTPAAPQTAPPTAPARPAPAMQMTEEVARMFAEAQQRAERAEAASQQFAERMQKLEADTRRKAFTDEVYGRSEANNVRWMPIKGELAPHVTFMEALVEKFGEGASEVTQYIEQQREVARQMTEQNALLRSQGIPGARTSDDSGRYATALRSFAESRPDLKTKEQREAAFLEEHKEFYTEYLQQNPAQTQRLG